MSKKSLFKFDEVSNITGVKSYVLRFWEAEFSEIAPLVSSTGEKIYGERDIDAVLTIKRLMFDEKKTIEEAKLEIRRVLSPEVTPEERESLMSQNEIKMKKLLQVREGLVEINSITERLKARYNWP